MIGAGKLLIVEPFECCFGEMNDDEFVKNLQAVIPGSLLD
jgi:hypothetical protein